jgi:hypothetical protein
MIKAGADGCSMQSSTTFDDTRLPGLPQQKRSRLARFVRCGKSLKCEDRPVFYVQSKTKGRTARGLTSKALLLPIAKIRPA